jgi:hypothetical protein
VRRRLSDSTLPAGLIPAWSSAGIELGVSLLFAVVAVAVAAAVCRRRA